MVCYCCDEDGTIVYGPVKKGKANKVILRNVPKIATSIAIEYLGENNLHIGFYSQLVDLNQKKNVYEIDNPEWKDINSVSDNVYDFRIEADSSVKLGQTIIFRAIAEMSEDKRIYSLDVTSLCDWSSKNFSIALNSEARPNVFRGRALGETVIFAYLGEQS